AVVAEHRSRVPQALDAAPAVHSVFEIRADHRRRVLRTQREIATAAVLERVHLLRHDVRLFAHRAHEQLRVLEDGRADAAVAVAVEGMLERGLDAPPALDLGGCHIVRAARSRILHEDARLLRACSTESPAPMVSPVTSAPQSFISVTRPATVPWNNSS